jgi:hypothetical protein
LRSPLRFASRMPQGTGIWGLSNHGKRHRTFSNRSNLPAVLLFGMTILKLKIRLKG